jgi:hypothetical protein
MSRDQNWHSLSRVISLLLAGKSRYREAVTHPAPKPRRRPITAFRWLSQPRHSFIRGRSFRRQASCPLQQARHSPKARQVLDAPILRSELPHKLSKSAHSHPCGARYASSYRRRTNPTYIRYAPTTAEMVVSIAGCDGKCSAPRNAFQPTAGISSNAAPSIVSSHPRSDTTPAGLLLQSL